jgi:glycosyltransferase involved in cell wall biosynthesis
LICLESLDGPIRDRRDRLLAAGVGMVTVATELARALVTDRDGDAYTLLCSRERPQSLSDLDCDAVLAPYRHELALKLRWLPAVEGRVGGDAILYPYWPSPPRRQSGAPPAAMFVYDLAFKLRPAEVPWQQRVYLGSILRPALRQAAAVLVISNRTRQDLLECYPLPGLDEKVSVVPLGVSNAVKAGALPDALQPGFILAVGTIEPRKNYPRLLAAYRALRARTDAPPLVIAGRPGWAYGDTLDRIRAEPGVRYLGHVDEPTLIALYESAGVLAFPSLYEGFGLPLLEAMSHGLPALVGATGALPELAGDAAVLVNPEDVEAIASGLENLLGDERLRARLRAASIDRAKEFTWERAADLTRRALRHIARCDLDDGAPADSGDGPAGGPRARLSAGDAAASPRARAHAPLRPGGNLRRRHAAGPGTRADRRQRRAARARSGDRARSVRSPRRRPGAAARNPRRVVAARRPPSWPGGHPAARAGSPSWWSGPSRDMR